MIHNIFRKEQNKQDLCKFGRLKRRKSEINPSCCPVYVFSKESYGQKHRDRQTVKDPLQIQNPYIINHGYNGQCDQSDDQSDDLSSLNRLLSTSDYHDAQTCQGKHGNQQRKFKIF